MPDPASPVTSDAIQALPDARQALKARAREAVSQGHRGDPDLERDLTAFLEIYPHDTDLWNVLGVAIACSHEVGQPLTVARFSQSADHFRRALLANPFHALASLNLVEALLCLNQGDVAVEQARKALRLLEDPRTSDLAALDGPHFPPVVDVFCAEWEKAATVNAGQPQDELRAKLLLIRWRLHYLLGEVTRDITHLHEAVLARPDIFGSQAALGCALGRAGRATDALPHLQTAFALNPTDTALARSLFTALGEVEDYVGQRRLAWKLDEMSRAGTIPAEPWFTGAAPGRPDANKELVEPLRIRWAGSQTAIHSLAYVNRELCRRLKKHGHELSLVTPGENREHEQSAALGLPLQATLSGPAQAHVGHRWPPDFTPPPSGHWVIMQPWEFGSIPRAWVPPMTELVDEVWAPSHYVRDCYIKSGIPAQQVRVVPNGVSDVYLEDDRHPFPLATKKRFKFLFVGGTIHRKGIDVLLEAYRDAFTRQDDVCLVVKDMGAATFYRDQTAQEAIAHLQTNPKAPEIEYLANELSEGELADLYAACDCLVHPYRGEGFGLPIAEAMGSGLPVIVTGHGAALDFCTEETAYFVPASVKRFSEQRIGALETVDKPWLAEPDVAALSFLLRHVVAHADEAKAKGRLARDFIGRHFTWDHAVAAVEARLAALVQKPIRRLQSTAPVGGNDFVVARSLSARPRVSLTMIVKNEEATLPPCLASVADLVDEMIVVDTGSTDATREIAKRAGAKVFEFPWVDSFAAARNESLSHASGDWIFWLDADDRLDEDNRRKLRQLFATLPELPAQTVGISMKCLCLPDTVTGESTTVDHIRLFRNHPAIRWKYRVHEQILGAIHRAGGTVAWADVVIHHTGYQDASNRRPKMDRDLRLLQLDIADNPGEPFVLFNLGWNLRERGRNAEAIPYLRESLAKCHVTDSIVRKLYYLLIKCHDALGQKEQAWEICQQGRKVCPNDPEIFFEEAGMLLDQGHLAVAEQSYLQLLEKRKHGFFASLNPALHGYLTRQNLGVVYLRMGRPADAERQWQLVLEERPGFPMALAALEELRRHRDR